jgi:RNA polymerase sigma-70 factor (ECF subfamily)
MPTQARSSVEADAWLQAFHAGHRGTMASLYHDHFATVATAVGRVVSGADKETVIHEVFFKLLSSEDERRRFQGGSVGAWITTVARNHAIDHARRMGRELSMPADELGAHLDATAGPGTAATARVLVQRFRDELPEPWRRVFDLCFLDQVSQRDAAATLGLPRTTLAYQHHRIRGRLREFLVPSRRSKQEDR